MQHAVSLLSFLATGGCFLLFCLGPVNALHSSSPSKERPWPIKSLTDLILCSALCGCSGSPQMRIIGTCSIPFFFIGNAPPCGRIWHCCRVPRKCTLLALVPCHFVGTAVAPPCGTRHCCWAPRKCASLALAPFHSLVQSRLPEGCGTAVGLRHGYKAANMRAGNRTLNMAVISPTLRLARVVSITHIPVSYHTPKRDGAFYRPSRARW